MREDLCEIILKQYRRWCLKIFFFYFSSGGFFLLVEPDHFKILVEGVMENIPVKLF